MNIKGLALIVVVIVFAITNVWSVMRLNSANGTNLSIADVECLANGENPSGYKDARNQFCEKPKGEKGCVDDTQGRTCTYTIFCIK